MSFDAGTVMKTAVDYSNLYYETTGTPWMISFHMSKTDREYRAFFSSLLPQLRIPACMKYCRNDYGLFVRINGIMDHKRKNV